jgi:hypothetical protein
MTKKKTWKVPLRKDGSLMDYADWGGGYHQPHSIEEPEVVWVLDLTFKDFERGRSAVTLRGEDDQGRHWPMKIGEFMAMLSQVTLCKGRIKGHFGVAKQGQNYSLTYLAAA